MFGSKKRYMRDLEEIVEVNKNIFNMSVEMISVHDEEAVRIIGEGRKLGFDMEEIENAYFKIEEIMNDANENANAFMPLNDLSMDRMSWEFLNYAKDLEEVVKGKSIQKTVTILDSYINNEADKGEVQAMLNNNANEILLDTQAAEYESNKKMIDEMQKIM